MPISKTEHLNNIWSCHRHHLRKMHLILVSVNRTQWLGALFCCFLIPWHQHIGCSQNYSFFERLLQENNINGTFKMSIIWTALRVSQSRWRTNKKSSKESIQGIRKRPTYRFENTIVWERWHFWRSEINIDYSASKGFVHLPCPSSNFVYRSLESTLGDAFDVNSIQPAH